MIVRVLSRADVVAALPMVEAVEAMKSAFAQYSNGNVILPQRAHMEVEHHQSTTLVMPAYLPETGEMAVKIVSVASRNPESNLPTIHALVTVLDPETGIPLCIMEGGSLTAIRTGAASGAATDILAPQSASSVAIIGSGVQARTQLEAVCAVRRIERAWVTSRNFENAKRYVDEMSGSGSLAESIEAVDSAKEALAEADVVCTATASTAPLFSHSALKKGAHINAVGSFTPQMMEIGLETLLASRVVVDSREAAMEEAGEIIQPTERGQYSREHIHAELGEIINGVKQGRTGEHQTTLFKSVGIAVQDAAAATRAYQNSITRNLGTEIDL